MKPFCAVALLCLVASPALALPQVYYANPAAFNPAAFANNPATFANNPSLAAATSTLTGSATGLLDTAKDLAGEGLDAATNLLPKTGPVVVNAPASPYFYAGAPSVPQVVTQQGNFPLPATVDITPEQRAKLVPVLKNLVAVLEKDVVDVNEVSALLAQSRDLFNEMSGLLKSFL